MLRFRWRRRHAVSSCGCSAGGVGLGLRLGAARQIETRGDDRPGAPAQPAVPVVATAVSSAAQLEPMGRGRSADADPGAARRDEPAQVRAERYSPWRKLIEGEASLLVGDGAGQRDAQRRHHGAGQRAAAFVRDGAGDSCRS